MSIEEGLIIDQRETYYTPEVKRIGSVNELTQGAVDPTSEQPGG